MIGIYGLFKKDTDECVYVGQSKDINGRIKSHFRGKNARFNEQEYYGEMIEQHFIDDKNYRLDREAYWINELNPKLNVIRDRHQPEEAKEKLKQYNLGKHPSEETRKKIGAGNLGKHLSDETKKKLSVLNSEKNHPMFGKHRSAETRKKDSEAKKDTKWINNGQINKRVKQDDLDKYISDGWKLGCLKCKRNL